MQPLEKSDLQIRVSTLVPQKDNDEDKPCSAAFAGHIGSMELLLCYATKVLTELCFR